MPAILVHPGHKLVGSKSYMKQWWQSWNRERCLRSYLGQCLLHTFLMYSHVALKCGILKIQTRGKSARRVNPGLGESGTQEIQVVSIKRSEHKRKNK